MREVEISRLNSLKITSEWVWHSNPEKLKRPDYVNRIKKGYNVRTREEIMEEKMQVCIAFLRAINVGGHTVKMDALRQPFVDYGLSQVETFLASGNVIFQTHEKDLSTLEKTLTQKVSQALGFETIVFLRTLAEVAALAVYPAFLQSELDEATAYNLAFLAAEPHEDGVRRLTALTSEIDRFQVHERQVYWLCQKKQSESTFSNAVLEKALGQSSTLRGISTLQKLLEKYN
jgi:uncharacterized protein (DUF1697 family)